MNLINSVNNQKIKEVVGMKKAGRRKASGLVLVDGAREIELAKRFGNEIVELFYCPGLTGKTKHDFFGLETERITEVSVPVFQKICYKEKPDGFAAIIKESRRSLGQLKLGQRPLVVILEAVEKPGNLGAIIRSAYAAGVDAVIINDSQTDIYNPNVIRASEGFIFVIPVVVETLEKTRGWLKQHNIISLAAATNGKKLYTQEKMDMPVALVFGSEADGLSDKWLKGADKIVKIPMADGIDSLNVSVSAALLMYEAVRQRQGQ